MSQLMDGNGLLLMYLNTHSSLRRGQLQCRNRRRAARARQLEMMVDGKECRFKEQTGLVILKTN